MDSDLSLHEHTGLNPSPGSGRKPRFSPTKAQGRLLESIFAETGQCPGKSVRQGISQHFGVEDRCIRNWFQNRRARAKTRKAVDAGAMLPTMYHAPVAYTFPGNDVPALVQGHEPHLQELLHESYSITILPCVELTIGTWRREVSFAMHDFVAYFSANTQCLSWFIRDATTGYAVKMDIPFTSILDMHISSLNGGPSEAAPLGASAVADLAKATILLSQPPQFYMEDVVETTMNQSMQLTKIWTPCQDWTPDYLATAVLQHDVVGSAGPLWYLLENFVQPAARATTEEGVGDGTYDSLLSSVGQYETRDFGMLPITTDEHSEHSEVVPPPDLSSLMEEPYDDSFFPMY